MGIFILMYAVLLLLWGFSSPQNSKTKENTIWILSFLTLWLIQALRDETVGTDLQVYIPAFNDIRSYNGGADISFEGGYTYYNLLISKYISTDHNLFLAITSFFSLFPITLLYKKYSRNQCLAYIIFSAFIIYHFSFSGLRQALALGIVATAAIFAFERRLIPFCLLILLASFFHKSSIISVVIYPIINYIRMTPVRYLWLTVAGVAIIWGLEIIVPFITSFIFGGDAYTGYYSHEVNASYNLFFLLVIFFLFTFLVKKPSRTLDSYRLLLYCCIITQSLGFISVVATRIGYYFFIFLPLILTQTIYELPYSKNSKGLISIGLAAFMIFFFLYSNSGGYLKVVPYKFYWE